MFVSDVLRKSPPFYYVPVIAAILLFLAIYPLLSFAQVSSGVQLTSCTTGSGADEEGIFEISAEDAVKFKCTIENKSDTEAKVLLSGERTEETDGESNSNASVAFAVNISPQAATTTSFNFLPVFGGGTYRYSITLKNIADGKSFGEVFNFTSISGVTEAIIGGAELDKSEYNYGEAAHLSISAIISSVEESEEGAGSAFFIDVVAKNKNGKECGYLVANQPFPKDGEPVSFLIDSYTAGCFISSVETILKTQEGFPRDRYSMPVTVKGVPGFLSKNNKTIVMLKIIAGLVIAYAFIAWRKEKYSRRNGNKNK